MAEFTLNLPAVQSGLTLTERVYATIKEAILGLDLPPGIALVEDDLARQLETSKTPVRDALLALERDGLVVKIPYKGTYVSNVSQKDTTEIFELRAVLEGLAARLATRSFSPRELDEAEKLLDSADEARMQGDSESASKFGAAFHNLIHYRAENRLLIPILEKLDVQLRRLRHLSDLVSGRLDKSGCEHRQILAALRTGDPLLAEAAMRNHLESVSSDLSFSNNDPTPKRPPPAHKENRS